jgi:hypothetical protein
MLQRTTDSAPPRIVDIPCEIRRWGNRSTSSAREGDQVMLCSCEHLANGHVGELVGATMLVSSQRTSAVWRPVCDSRDTRTWSTTSASVLQGPLSCLPSRTNRAKLNCLADPSGPRNLFGALLTLV